MATRGATCLIVDIDDAWHGAGDGSTRRCSRGRRRFAAASSLHLAHRLHGEFRLRDEVSRLAIESIALGVLAEASRRVAREADAPGAGAGCSRRARWSTRISPKPLPLADVARRVGVHPVHLARTFRRVHQITFAGYVRHVRIEFARRELAASGASLSDIAVAAGFCDQSHFSRLFKRYTGQTPAEYRLRQLRCRAKPVPIAFVDRVQDARTRAVRHACAHGPVLEEVDRRAAGRSGRRASCGDRSARGNLTALGIGSIIGTGIFVLTGTAASQNAGPALVLSMIISAVGCAFSGLCYAEFAAMVPVAGQRLHLRVRDDRRARRVDHRLGPDPRVRAERRDRRGRLVRLLREPRCATFGIVIPPSLAGRRAPDGLFNLPAALIVARGRRRCSSSASSSRRTRTRVLVAIKTIVLVVFVVAGAVVREAREPDAVHSAEHRRVRPVRLERRAARRRRDVLRVHRLRRRVDRGAGGEEPAARHADRHPRLAGDLHGASTSRVAIVLIGIVPYQQLNVADPLAVGHRRDRDHVAEPGRSRSAALFGLFSTMLVQLLGQTRIFYSMSRDGLLPPLFARRAPAVPDAAPEHDAHRHGHRGRRRADADRACSVSS